MSKFVFPVALNETTRLYLERLAQIEGGQIAADIRTVLSGSPDPATAARLSDDPAYNAILRTTCVATSRRYPRPDYQVVCGILSGGRRPADHERGGYRWQLLA